MNLDHFLKLPERERAELVEIHQKQMIIRAEYERIKKQKSQLETALANLQMECTHPFVIKMPRADTGNYDPSGDRYWYDCTCPDCGDKWEEDQ